MTSFAEKFRPKNPNQLIGESQIKTAQALMDKLDKGEVLQELLFTGDSGLGKTTIAYMYASKLMGVEITPDNADAYIQEINCTSDTGIDNIRNVVLADLYYAPLGSEYKIYFLDEVHGLSKQAQNSLLKDVESLPTHVIMIAGTTDPNKLIKTLRSRFTEFRLKPPTQVEFRKKFGWIVAALKKQDINPKIEITNTLMNDVINLAAGNIRTFDRLVEQVIDGSYTGEESAAENDLFKGIFYQSPNLSKWFKLAESEANYSQATIGLCSYSIAILKNPSSNAKSTKIASNILEVFGNGLSLNTSEKISFYSGLLKLYKCYLQN